jgi:hypothetical protein
MAISFELPPSIEQLLRVEIGDLDAAAKESALVELFRQRKLTRHQLGVAMGFDRFETEALLKQHRVTEDLLTPAEHAEQVSDLRRLLGE